MREGDIRSEDSVRAAIDATVKKFGGIDILVNNASAINVSGWCARATGSKRLLKGERVCVSVCLCVCV